MSATKTKAKSTKPKFDLYQQVTDTIISALERGVVPWQKPWTAPKGLASAHRSMISKKPYRGINVWLLDLAAANNGYELPYWLTWKQVEKLGGKVKEDERKNYTLVTFWTTFLIEEEVNGQVKKKVIPMLRYYRVYNVAQVEGLDAKVAKLSAKLTTDEPQEFDPIERAEWILRNMPSKPRTAHRGDRAFYQPASDAVTLPKPEQFTSPEAYYNTAFHEFAHATGHESRLGRMKDWTSFGSEPYAKEELVAEMSAAMLSRVCNIDNEHEASASYIESWLKVLKGDKKFVVTASAQAQKASDFILGVTYTEKES